LSNSHKNNVAKYACCDLSVPLSRALSHVIRLVIRAEALTILTSSNRQIGLYHLDNKHEDVSQRKTLWWSGTLSLDIIFPLRHYLSFLISRDNVSNTPEWITSCWAEYILYILCERGMMSHNGINGVSRRQCTEAAKGQVIDHWRHHGVWSHSHWFAVHVIECIIVHVEVPKTNRCWNLCRCHYGTNQYYPSTPQIIKWQTRSEMCLLSITTVQMKSYFNPTIFMCVYAVT
jgi:hypothetical protein